LGNNEFHLKTLKHAINYHYSSDKKIHELIDMAKELEKDGIYLLNGDVVEYKGIKFGGAMGWYDGSYAKKLDSSFDDKFIQKRWEETNNDYKFILNLKTYRVMFLTEIIKLYKIIDQVDVMISHINPISEPIAFPSKYKESEDNAYFCFDGGKIIEKTTAKYWIYGHNHESWNYNLFNTKFLSNPLGYPMESMLRDNTLKSFLINSKK
jgi:Icc-related predicted phosphoesterase